MGSTFATYRVSQLRPPLNGPQGETWATVLGGIQDQELALLRVAALSRLPATCPDDGLDLLGLAYALPRLPGQSHASYRATLQAAWPTYEEGGSPQSVVDALVALGYHDVLVLEVWRAPAPFLPETSATDYSEFYIFLGPGYGTTGIVQLILGSAWNLGISGSGLTLGSSMTATQLLAAKRAILRWKAAHGRPVKISLLFGADVPGTSLATYPIGRCLADTWGPLGDPTCVLGGYQL